MPPNVSHSWDLIAVERHLHATPVRSDDKINGNRQYSDFNEKLFISPPNTSNEFTSRVDYGRTLWKRILRNNANTTTIVDDIEESEHSRSSNLLMSLYSIRILNDEVREKEWLKSFGGELSNVSSELLEGLR